MNFFEFNKRFPTELDCINYYIEKRYKGELCCHHCGSVRLTHVKAQPKQFKCHACNNMFSIFKGTIFEHSSTDLRKWFYAIRLFLNGKKGISSPQLQREIGVTLKCAWRILKKIREAMGNDDDDNNGGMLSGLVELDECYIGGKAENMHMSKRIAFKGKFDKATVFGMLERNRKLARIFHVESAKYSVLGQKVLDNIDYNSTIVTDEFKSYTLLKNFYMSHETVNHSAGNYKNGLFHTNSIESFWATLKRGIFGIYHSVSRKYLQNYINEFCFRYNNKDSASTFDLLMSKTVVKEVKFNW